MDFVAFAVRLSLLCLSALLRFCDFGYDRYFQGCEPRWVAALLLGFCVPLLFNASRGFLCKCFRVSEGDQDSLQS